MNNPVPMDKDDYPLVGFTNCDKKREQRTKEAQELWNKILNTKGYRETILVFIDTYPLLSEALNSYQNGGFMATAIMCRVVGETAFYNIAIIKNIIVKKVFEEQHITEIEKDECIIRLIKHGMKVEYGFLENILREKGYVDRNVKKLADRIRKRGNYVAHYPTMQERKLIQYLEGKISDRYLWYTRKKALKQLNDTVELIRLLIMKVYNEYFEKG